MLDGSEILVNVLCHFRFVICSFAYKIIHLICCPFFCLPAPKEVPSPCPTPHRAGHLMSYGDVGDGTRTRASVYGHFVVLLPSGARKLCPIKVEVCASVSVFVSVSVSAFSCSRKRLMANGNYNLRQRAAKDSSAAS